MLTALEVRELADLGSATVYEAAGRQGLVEASFLRLIPGSRAAGPALPVQCAQDDNLGAHAAMAVLQPGEVLVLTMPTAKPVALVGELLATQAKARQAAALLVDGAVRDCDELVALGLPVWARWLSPRGAKRENVLGIGVPVVLGGVQIRLGDYVVLDGDGIVVVPRERAREVLQRARERIEREAQLRELFAQGKLSLDIYGLREKVEGALAQAQRLREEQDG
ncbi:MULTISPECIES: dimethylmenaquinone methyltransferase [Thermus]|uniref:Regulator of ribonuclease activity homolog n=1 Tax=Thermus scotoductus (strain ATCC 700910 / SA-01) TaxID=743525 RepID=E8PQA4_THESS|nr:MULTISPECIES: dimethylmenaquinone methyltransferase [Thermus]ADW21763.1 dimethylmenaquinone methyltransferase [Thermus scotoductus SA-01]